MNEKSLKITQIAIKITIKGIQNIFVRIFPSVNFIHVHIYHVFRESSQDMLNQETFTDYFPQNYTKSPKTYWDNWGFKCSIRL